LISHRIEPSKALGYSGIYLDFLAENDSARSFYLSRDIGQVASSLDAITFDRQKLVGILTRQNHAYGASNKTFETIDRLLDPRAICVFSGQQAGLIGGPLYSLVKALAIVKASKQYEQQLNRPVLPVFWIAGDDHDIEEANHTWLLDRSHQPCEIRYDSDFSEGLPAAETLFSNKEVLSETLSRIRTCLGDTDYTPALYELIERSYTPEDTFATAFGKFMAGVTADLGLVLFCPGDEEVKRHAIPFFKQIVEQQDRLHELIDIANHRIVNSGYHIQVDKKDNAAYLFYNLNGRHPITREGESFLVGPATLSGKELLQCIEERPERFSPDVITRPAFQSYLFPTVSQKGGPSEIAYLAQINPIFSVFSLPPPYHKARSTVTLVEKRFEKLMNDYEISFEELTGDIELVVNRILEKSFPKDLEQRFAGLRTSVLGRFDEFSDQSLTFDPSLNDFGRQIFGKIDFALKAFEGKVFSSHKKKSKETRDRIYRLWHALYINRGLQERSLNITYFISRYGFDVVKFIYDKMDSEESAHQLLYLSEMDS
jgi:bacillithiol biosynthesis cysteine-adding enzyme BshC